MHAFDPALKLIVLVRDPVERAYSQYHMHVRFGYETGTFEEALAREDAILPGQLDALAADPDDDSILINRVSYVARGRYVDQLERWLTFFPREQLLVVVSEDLLADPATEMARVADFLEIPPQSADSYPRLHVGEYSPMSPETRESLARIFADDNRRLEALLGRTLRWTAPAGSSAEVGATAR